MCPAEVPIGYAEGETPTASSQPFNVCEWITDNQLPDLLETATPENFEAGMFSVTPRKQGHIETEHQGIHPVIG